MMWLVTSWLLFAAAIAWPARFVVRHLWRWSRRRTHCESCGYSLNNRVSDRCPECGYDVATRSPLIHARRVVLHTTIVLELLIASHLFHRLEAIQKRGWIAALPTTFLIMRFSAHELEWARRWAVSPLRRELAFRAEYFDVFVDPDLRVDTDVIARWQQRWLVAKALHIDYGPQLISQDWQIPAVRILNGAWERDLLTSAQRSRVSCMCFVKVTTRDHWPLGTPITAVMEPRFLVYADGYRLTAHAITPGYTDHEISRRSIDSFIEPSANWTLGVAAESGPVEYELSLERYHSSTNTWEGVGRENRVITVVADTTEHGLTAAQVPEDVFETLSPRIGVSASGLRTPAVWFDVAASDSFKKALGATRLSIVVTLFQDGKKLGSGSGTWVSPDQPHRDWSAPFGGLLSSSMTKWAVTIQPDTGWRWSESQLAEDHSWNVVIEGDPHVALQDFDATSYWSGRYEFKDIPADATIW